MYSGPLCHPSFNNRPLQVPTSPTELQHHHRSAAVAAAGCAMRAAVSDAHRLVSSCSPKSFHPHPCRPPLMYSPWKSPIITDLSETGFFSQTTLCLGLLFYSPEQDENTYRKSFKNGSPTDDVVKPSIKNMYYYLHYYFNIVIIFFNCVYEHLFCVQKGFVCEEVWF